MRTLLSLLAFTLPTIAHAQVCTCDILQHWRNAAINFTAPVWKLRTTFRDGSLTSGVSD
jgi:hypothetical protein